MIVSSQPTEETRIAQPPRTSLAYRCFRKYAGYINTMYFWHRYEVDKNHVPVDGNAVVMVGNHQNCMCDPMNVELMLNDRKTHCLVRSDVFKNKVFTYLLDGIGLLPISRVGFEGEAAFAKNGDTFKAARKTLTEGQTLILFPEAGHQNKRWLGTFSLAYLKLAFEAAEDMHFEKEVYIMPFAHHYEQYHLPGYDMMVHFGTPIALSPYYELYRTKPRTAQRKVNELVRSQIASLMLNITDLPHYDAIDYLRQSAFGIHFAESCGLRPSYLPLKLKADQKLAQILQTAAEQDPVGMEQLYARVDALQANTKKLGLRDWVLEQRPSLWYWFVRCLAMLLTFPLFFVGILVALPVVAIPRKLHHVKINGAVDEMFQSTFNVGVTALVTYPLLGVVLPLLLGICLGWMWGLAFFILYPLNLLFVCRWHRAYAKIKGVTRYVWGDKTQLSALEQERSVLFDELQQVVAQVCEELQHPSDQSQVS